MRMLLLVCALFAPIAPAGAVTLSIQDTYNSASNGSPLKDADNSWANARGNPQSGTPGNSSGAGSTGTGTGGGSSGGSTGGSTGAGK